MKMFRLQICRRQVCFGGLLCLCLLQVYFCLFSDLLKTADMVKKMSRGDCDAPRGAEKTRDKSGSLLMKIGLALIAAALLLASAVGSTRAALTYRSDNDMREISVSQIGVTLLENGAAVSSRDYDKDEWKVTTNRGGAYTSGALFENLLKKGESLALNKKYEEKLAVKNSGTIDEYVRVRIYKYWMRDGKKVTLSLIHI